MDLVRRGNFCSNVKPVCTTVKILYLKQIVCKSGIFKPLKLLLFKYGGLARYLNYYLNIIRRLKELAEALGYRTHN
jgi:hypothetical protein